MLLVDKLGIVEGLGVVAGLGEGQGRRETAILEECWQSLSERRDTSLCAVLLKGKGKGLEHVEAVTALSVCLSYQCVKTRQSVRC